MATLNSGNTSTVFSDQENVAFSFAGTWDGATLTIACRDTVSGKDDAYKTVATYSADGYKRFWINGPRDWKFSIAGGSGSESIVVTRL